MGTNVYIGLAVTARNNGTTCTASFDNLSLSGTIPTPPAGVAATVISSSQVDLSWIPTTGAASYNVKRALVSGGPYATVATGVGTASFSDTGLSADTTYYYVISAVNTAESANSAEVNATTVTMPPSGLSATVVSSSQINLSWNVPAGATGYNVKRATVSGGPYAMIASGITASSYSDTGLSGGTTYYYVVSAISPGGESSNSSEVSASTVYPPLAVGTGAGQVLLFWPASGGTNYILEMTTNLANGTWTPVTNAIPQVAFTLSNSAPGMFFRLH
jgi:cellulose 1,4-beta-cellobiosidase